MRKLLVAVIVCICVVLSVVVVEAAQYLENSGDAAPGAAQTSDAQTEATDFDTVNIGAPDIVVPDDYPDITNAVDHAQNGDVILVRDGTYLESVTITKSLTIEGQGKDTIVDGNNLGPAFLIEADNVTITGFRIRNVENAPTVSDSTARLAGIHLLGASDCRVFNNTVVNCGKGIWIYGGAANQIVNNTFLSNNYGIIVDSSSQNILRGNVLADGWNGMLLDNSQNNVLKNNDMYNNTANFGVTGESAVAYQNSVDTSNLADGKKVYYLTGLNGQIISPQTYPDLGTLILSSSRDVTIQNLVITNSYSGLQLFNIQNVKVQNNSLTNTKYGIYLGDSNDCTLQDNTVKNSSTTGINVVDSSGININGNMFEQTGSVTLNLVRSSGCSVEKNTFIGYHAEGISLDSSNNNYIANNAQSGTDIVMYVFWIASSSNNQFESNKFTLCALPFWINGSDYNTISGNSFSTNTGYYGMSLNAANHNTISDNIFYNFTTGLELSNGADNIIARNTITSKEHAMELFQFSNNTFDSNQFLGSTDVWDMGPTAGKQASANTWK